MLRIYKISKKLVFIVTNTVDSAGQSESLITRLSEIAPQKISIYIYRCR